MPCTSKKVRIVRGIFQKFKTDTNPMRFCMWKFKYLIDSHLNNSYHIKVR